jgi:hypothetical protein
MINQITVTRERLYGGPLSKGPRYRYVACLNGTQIDTGGTREIALANAVRNLLGAFNCSTSSIYASPTPDGTVCVTREYAPDLVQFSYHRQSDGRGSGICLSKLEINGKRVSVAEYHAHYTRMYAESLKVEIKPEEVPA